MSACPTSMVMRSRVPPRRYADPPLLVAITGYSRRRIDPRRARGRFRRAFRKASGQHKARAAAFSLSARSEMSRSLEF